MFYFDCPNIYNTEENVGLQAIIHWENLRKDEECSF
jgi:hypothetical protein